MNLGSRDYGLCRDILSFGENRGEGKGFKLHFLFRPQLARLDFKSNAVFVVVVVVVDDAVG